MPRSNKNNRVAAKNGANPTDSSSSLFDDDGGGVAICEFRAPSPLPADRDNVVKDYPHPKRAGGTLFLSVDMPESVWKRAVDVGKFDEVYIPLASRPAEEIKFAHQVRNYVLTKHRMGDPVIVGPVGCAVMTEHQDQIKTLGLRISGLDQDAYRKMSRSEAVFRRTKVKHGHSV
jgi:hypothetical protein